MNKTVSMLPVFDIIMQMQELISHYPMIPFLKLQQKHAMSKTHLCLLQPKYAIYIKRDFGWV